MEKVRVHTYWMSCKEYSKMVKRNSNIKIIHKDGYVTRTHIYFE